MSSGQPFLDGWKKGRQTARGKFIPQGRNAVKFAAVAARKTFRESGFQLSPLHFLWVAKRRRQSLLLDAEVRLQKSVGSLPRLVWRDGYDGARQRAGGEARRQRVEVQQRLRIGAGSAARRIPEAAAGSPRNSAPPKGPARLRPDRAMHGLWFKNDTVSSDAPSDRTNAAILSEIRRRHGARKAGSART